MLDVDTLNKFIKKANIAHQQLCIWFSTNNEFAKHQIRWNTLDPDIGPFGLENFTRRHGCRFKNFWGVVLPTLQHGWCLSTARLFDSAYHFKDKNKERPRISLDYILINHADQIFSDKVRKELQNFGPVIESLKKHRDHIHAHNDAKFQPTRIEAGVEDLFEWLEALVEKIKEKDPYLKRCDVINLGYNEKISQCGVDEVFDGLLLAEDIQKTLERKTT